MLLLSRRHLFYLFLLSLTVGSSFSLQCYTTVCDGRKCREEKTNCSINFTSTVYDRELEAGEPKYKSNNLTTQKLARQNESFNYECIKNNYLRDIGRFKKGDVEKYCYRYPGFIWYEPGCNDGHGRNFSSCSCDTDLCNGKPLLGPISLLEIGGIMVSLYWKHKI